MLMRRSCIPNLIDDHWTMKPMIWTITSKNCIYNFRYFILVTEIFFRKLPKNINIFQVFLGILLWTPDDITTAEINNIIVANTFLHNYFDASTMELNYRRKSPILKWMELRQKIFRGAGLHIDNWEKAYIYIRVDRFSIFLTELTF